ncbi:hypothetical protein [Arthrobacter sp. TMS2-4]
MTNEGDDSRAQQGWEELPLPELENLRSTRADTVLAILARSDEKPDQQVLLSAAMMDLNIIDEALHVVRHLRAGALDRACTRSGEDPLP